MKSRPFPAIVCGLLAMLLLLMAGHMVAKDKKSKKTVCSNPHPEQLCTAANTCGSSGSPCLLDIKRTGGGSDASVTPNIPDFPKNSVICIKTGTTVTWQSTNKNTGFMVDFASGAPFEPSDTISGGTARPVTVTAKKPGCYSYTVGACTPGTIYGMCGNAGFDLVVIAGDK